MTLATVVLAAMIGLLESRAPTEHAPPKLTSGQEVHEFLPEQQYTGAVGALIQKINSILEQWPSILIALPPVPLPAITPYLQASRT